MKLGPFVSKMQRLDADGTKAAFHTRICDRLHRNLTFVVFASEGDSSIPARKPTRTANTV